jgi:hypothetical protein
LPRKTFTLTELMNSSSIVHSKGTRQASHIIVDCFQFRELWRLEG